MEKLVGSSFGKFEGSEIANLSAIKGGDIATGMGCEPELNITFTSDCIADDGKSVTFDGIKDVR